jgi:anti-sigma28 factor (negative regulator of flagellin synthesis)
MNINELRRRRNAALTRRNKSRTTAHRTYKNRRTAKAAAIHNKSAKARARVSKLKQQRKAAPNRKSRATGINLKRVNRLNNRITDRKAREAKPSTWSLW